MTENEENNISDVMDSVKDFEKTLEKTENEKYILHLYVAGMGPKSIQAIDNIKRILEEYMPGKYEIDIIDIYKYPILAKDGQIVAAPTLVKELPPPLRKLIGSMSNTERVLVGMDFCKTDKK